MNLENFKIDFCAELGAELTARYLPTLSPQKLHLLILHTLINQAAKHNLLVSSFQVEEIADGGFYILLNKKHVIELELGKEVQNDY